MPVNVVQPMVTLESFLPAPGDMKSKELELTRQFYEKQMELLKSLKSSFYPENEDPLSNSQVSVLLSLVHLTQSSVLLFAFNGLTG